MAQDEPLITLMAGLMVGPNNGPHDDVAVRAPVGAAIGLMMSAGFALDG